MFYESSGKGAAIIFVHDGLVHREIWDAQIPFFAQKYQAIRYDRRGYGNSPAATERYSIIEDLNSLMVQLKIEKACLVGMSSGGGLAVDFTLQYPQKVSSLVLVGAVITGFSFTDHFYTRGGHLPPNPTREQSRDYYASADPYEMYSGNTAAKTRVAELLRLHPNKDTGTYPRIPPKRMALPYLNEIKVPTLILVGEFDIPDVHAHAGAINAGIPGSKRDLIAKSGHLVPIEQPAAFNAAVSVFLNAMRR
jgi:pimeloyl-ACP methyl ester carboxylesterase